MNIQLTKIHLLIQHFMILQLRHTTFITQSLKKIHSGRETGLIDTGPLKKTSGGKYFLTHLKSPKTVQFTCFQSRINHNHKILDTNTLLYKIKLIGGPKCTFCNKTDETIEHLLWECECVKRFLNETISWLIQHGIHITLNE